LAVAVAVALVGPVGAAFAVSGAAQGVGFGPEQGVDERGEQLAQDVGVVVVSRSASTVGRSILWAAVIAWFLCSSDFGRSLEESRDDPQSVGYDTPVPLIRSDSYTTLLDATPWQPIPRTAWRSKRLPWQRAVASGRHPLQLPARAINRIRTRGGHPGHDGYRELFTNPAISERRQACYIHTGNWTVVLPAVIAFLEPFPASADTAAISHAARNHEPFADLTTADRRLALALLSYSDSLRIYTNGHDRRETIGQHRIC
jgi:hypothetical protein